MNRMAKGIAALVMGLAGVFGFGCASQAGSEAAQPAVKPEAEMVRLTANLRDYAREKNPSFLLVGNGAVGLLEVTEKNPEEQVSALVGALDGVMMESVFYDDYEEDGKEAERRDADTEEYLAAMLRKPLLAGKTIFTLDYVKGKKIREVERLGREAGYLSEAGVRALDAIPSARPQDENSDDVTQLRQAKNFLVLLNPGQWTARESYLAALAATNYDVLIVDLYYGGAPLTADEVARLQKKGNGARRLVLAYMSVGEAADYRPYWQEAWNESRPDWLANPNPEWPGSYKARYWRPEWQALLYGSEKAYLDRIVAAGFDGAFLDVMDAWQYFKDRG